MDRDAGRRRTLKALALAGPLAMFWPRWGRAQGAAPLNRVMRIDGGFAAPEGALPGLMPRGPAGGYVKLMYPSALAAAGPDLFVADSGLGALLRIDTLTLSVARLARIPTVPGVRLRTGADGTLFMLRPDRAELVRLDRSGRLLRRYDDTPELAIPTDFVIAPFSNAVWLMDADGTRYEFHPGGRVFGPLPPGPQAEGLPPQLSHLAAGRGRVVGIDSHCGCAIEWNQDGRQVAVHELAGLGRPGAVAMDDDDRLWIVDRGDRRLKLFEQFQPTASMGFAELGLGDITALAIDHRRLYLADGLSAAVLVFEIAPAGRKP
ncbi:MAG: hypothetical protein JNM61_07220 [Zoogloeaceae bacterium]|nr:hypothetical protein [Zoogloeaceae bacterium]